VYDFLLVTNSILGPISHCYWDTATYRPKIANFAHPPSHLAPSFGVISFEFMKKPKTIVFQAADDEDLVIALCTIFDLSTHVTDRQMDRIAMAKTRWKQ